MMIRPSLSPDYIIYLLLFDVCLSLSTIWRPNIHKRRKTSVLFFLFFLVFIIFSKTISNKKNTLSKSTYISMKVLLDDFEWNMRH
jgi:hypothetical protein